MSTEKTHQDTEVEQLTDSQKLHIRELQLKRADSLLQLRELESVIASISKVEAKVSKEIEDYVFSIFGSDRVILDSDLNVTRVK